MRFVRDNGLSIVFLAIFLLTLVGQAIAGHGSFNHDQLLHHGATISFGRYLTTSEFAADVAENWQSEYLQFTLYILGTVWLLQRGSPESKPLDKAGPRDRRGPEGRRSTPTRDSPRWAGSAACARRSTRTRCWSSWTMILVGCWLAQSIAGAQRLQHRQLDHQAATRELAAATSATADFWNRTLQNWQSEFLAVGSMAILSVYLRQRGSPESKPVGAPHDATGVEG